MATRERGPRLEVTWGGDLKDFWDALRTLAGLFAWPTPEEESGQFHLPPARFNRSTAAWLLSLLLHVLFLVTPLPEFLTRPAAPPAGQMARIELDLNWMSNSRTLPPISPVNRTRKEPSPGGKENRPLPPPGADRVHPQTIISNPPNPNHPTQTLQHQLAIEKANVQKPDLQFPNMVIPPSDAPSREVDLRRLRIPNAPVDLTGPPQAPQIPRPKSRAELALEETKLENLVPRLTLPATTGEEKNQAAPDVQAGVGVPRSGDLNAPAILALSEDPGAPSPVLQLPEENLRARFAVGPYTGAGSPGGIPGGIPGAEGGAGGGPGGIAGGPGTLTAPDIFVAPAGPVPSGPVIAGGVQLRGATLPPPPREALPERPRPQSRAAAPNPTAQSAQQRAEELLNGISPGTRPNQTPYWRRVYTIYINMPNLTSQTGSWVLRFAEMGDGQTTAPGGAADFPLAAPVPVKKVDPRYPPTVRRLGIQGTVSLYGIIRSDGSVDNVQVVRGLHQDLDQSAVEAFQHWRFAPGSKNGSPITLEVVIDIPFRLTKLF